MAEMVGGIVVKAGAPVFIDMTALKEAGEGGKFYPHQLSPGDYINLEVEEASNEPKPVLSATLDLRHITWGD